MADDPQTDPNFRQPSWVAPLTPLVPDHQLVRRIGGGSYGDVWLARTAVGTWRAVKVVFRDRFTDDRPYEREFSGMRSFEPLSRRNEAFVDILQVGRNDANGYFYYVMELADDIHPEAFDPETYIPRTLAKVLLGRNRLPVDECLELGLTLNLGLAQLHQAGLIHRDIKPSNIIFVGDVPKLADIGLVIEMSEARSFVGTDGFIPPEGPNSAQADLYSLGKVLYEAGMGKDRKDFPEPFTRIATDPESTRLLEFNAILLKACAADRAERYRSAEEMNADLALLRSGGSVRRQRRLAGQLRRVQRAGALVTVLAAVVALGWWWQARQTARVRELAEANLKLAQAAGSSATQAAASEAAARESLYAADIQLAQQALQSDNLRLARALLQNHVPRPGQPDLRGFEWRYLWHQSRSQEKFSLPGNRHSALVIAASPDHRLLAVGGFDGGRIRIFDLATRAAPIVLPDDNRILSLAFPPGQNLLVSASPEDVRCWNLTTFEEVRRLPGAAAPAVLSPDGRFLLTGTGPWNSDYWNAPKELVVWDTATWTRVASTTLPASGGFSIARHLYLQVAFGSDPGRVAVLVGDRVRILTCPGLEEIRTLAEPLPASSASRPFLALSPDNRTLAIPSSRGFGIRLWDIGQDREIRVLPGHSDHVFAARFSPDGRTLASGSPDQTTRLWQVETGDLVHSFAGQADEVIDVAFSSDGSTLFSLGVSDSIVMAWDPRARPRSTVLRDPFWPFGFDPGGGLAGVMQGSGQGVLLDPATLEQEPTPIPAPQSGIQHDNVLNSLSRDGRYQHLWSAREQQTEIWDRIEGRRVCTLPALYGRASFDTGLGLVTTFHTNAAGDRVLAAWRLTDGQPAWTLPDQWGYTPGFVGTRQGSFLLLTHEESLQLFQVGPEGPRPVLQLEGDTFATASLSPDARWICGGTADIRIRRMPDGERVGLLRGHTRKNTRHLFSPDSRTLATTADDRTLRLWHLATQRELLRFQSPEEDRGTYTHEFSPDGRALACFRVDASGPATTLLFAPSFAEIAVVEGADHESLAGDDPGLWLAVAGELGRRGRLDEALGACDRAIELSAKDAVHAWLPPRAQRLRERLVPRNPGQ